MQQATEIEQPEPRKLQVGELLMEASVVGIATVIMGTIIAFILSYLMQPPTTEQSNPDWNKNHVMELALFFTGFGLHAVFELFGWNQWYCAQRYAKSKTE